jgi:uncharacterized membrane protein YfcA
MLDIVDYLLLFVLGSLGAFIAGLLGVGGGIIYIPILDYFLSKLGLSNDALVKAILANSLFTIIFSGSVASYKQYKMKNFFPREILYTAIPGVVSAVIMTYFIKAGSWYSKEAFNYVFGTMLLVIILRMFFAKPKTSDSGAETIPVYKYSLTGLMTGVVTALSGLGGGVLMTPIFTDGLKLNIKKSSSISNGVIPILAIGIGLYNLSSVAPQILPGWQQVGFIVLPVTLPMIAATFIFAPIGVKVAQTTRPQILRIIFASFISIVFIKLLYEILF